MKKITTQFIKGSTVAILGFGLALTALAGTWTAPTGTPPNNNVDEPINVSSASQAKEGALRVGALGAPYQWTTLDVQGVLSAVGFANFGASDLAGKVTIGCLTGPCPTASRILEVANGDSFFHNKIGVGIGSPDSQIHVHSANSMSSISISSGSANWMKLYQPFNSGELRIGQGATGSISDIATFKAAGNVGIGTTNPTKKLEVYGPALIGGEGVSIAGSNSHGVVYLGDTNHYIRSVYGGGLRLGTAGATDALNIKEGNGYVGIGLGRTNPQERLDVGGNIIASGNIRSDTLEIIHPGSTATIFNLYIDICSGTRAIVADSHCWNGVSSVANAPIGIKIQSQ